MFNLNNHIFMRVRCVIMVFVAAMLIVAVGHAQTSVQKSIDNSIEPFGFHGYFINYCGYFRDEDELRKGRVLDFGVSDQELKLLRQRIWDGVMRGAIPYSAGHDAAYYGKLIGDAVDKFSAQQAPKGSNLLKQWLCAEAVVAWVARNVKYQVAKEDPYKDGNWTLNAPSNVLKRESPWAQCCGYSMLTRDIARIAGKRYGLGCEYVGGWFRGVLVGEAAPAESNHAWNIFNMDGGIVVPADVTSASTVVSTANDNNPILRDRLLNCLPLSRVEWEVFLAGHWGDLYPNDASHLTGVDFGKVKLGVKDATSDISLKEWRKIDIKPWMPIAKHIYLEGIP